MELLLGRSFRFRLLEEGIRSMRVGERCLFPLLPLPLTQPHYPLFSTQFRAYVRSRNQQQQQQQAAGGQGQGEEEVPQHRGRCCGGGGGGGSQSTGHADLDDLVARPRPLSIQVDLLSLESESEYEREVWQMEEEEKRQAIPVLLDQGRRLYRDGKDFESASRKFGKALTLLHLVQDREQRGEEEWLSLERGLKPLLLSNFAQSRFAVGDYYGAIRHSTDVLAIDPGHVKSLFRRGRAYAAVWDWEAARSDLVRAASLDPGLAGAVSRELESASRIRRTKEEEERRRLQGRLFPPPSPSPS